MYYIVLFKYFPAGTFAEKADRPFHVIGEDRKDPPDKIPRETVIQNKEKFVITVPVVQERTGDYCVLTSPKQGS